MKRWLTPTAIIFLTVFIDLMGFGIVIPLLPFYAQTLGAGGVEVGLLLSIFSLMTFIFMPLWGRLSDRFGRRPMLLVTIAISTVGYVLFSIAGSFVVLLIARTLAGIGNANLSVAQAYIADITPAEQRSKGMGMIGAAFGLGFVFGPLIGGIFSAEEFGPWKYSLPGWVAAALSLLNFISVMALVKETRHALDTKGFPLFDVHGFTKAFRRGPLRDRPCCCSSSPSDSPIFLRSSRFLSWKNRLNCRVRIPVGFLRKSVSWPLWCRASLSDG